MKASPDLIAEAGQLLFGSQWQSDLAAALKVSRRAVQRWRVGDDEPRPGVWTDIAALVDARISELRRMRPVLVAQAKASTRT